MKRLVLLIVLMSVLLSACSKKSKYMQELETQFKASPDNIELCEKLMQAYLLETEEIDKVILLYESNADRHDSVMHDRVMVRIYYSTALCMKAGISKKPADKLKYVRNGMHAFDETINDYPEDARCYMWQAITYSNFPAMLGADDFAVEAIKNAELYHKKDSPRLVDEELKQLFNAAYNLYDKFNNDEYLLLTRRIYESYDLERFEECVKKMKKAEGK